MKNFTQGIAPYIGAFIIAFWTLYFAVESSPFLLWMLLAVTAVYIIGNLERTKYVIPKGWHYSLHLPGFWLKQDRFAYKITFTESCRYNHFTNDQLDWNKLFGFAYGLGIHKNSARFVWRYNVDTNLIEIGAYIYQQEQRVSVMLCSCVIGEALTLDITRNGGLVTFYIDKIPGKFLPVINPGKSWGLRLLPYFGGNLTAPHPITILTEKLY